jgi:hypothetical protein
MLQFANPGLGSDYRNSHAMRRLAGAGLDGAAGSLGPKCKKSDTRGKSDQRYN